MDKSYVTLAVCPICKQETGTLLMDTHLRARFNMHTMTPEPCDLCKKKYLTKGVLLISPTTGDLAVIKLAAFKRMFNVPVPQKHIAFAEQEVINQLTQGQGERNG